MNDIGGIVREVAEKLGTFTKQTLAVEVRNRITDETYQSTTWPGFVRTCIKAAGQEAANGLPGAASVDNKGTYVQQELWTPDDFVVIATRYLDQGAASVTKAERVSAVCEERYGKPIDVHAMWKARRPA